MLFTCVAAFAQRMPADTGIKRNHIQILDNQVGEFIQNDTSSVHKLKGNVKLLHGSDTLYCDSAYFYTKRNSVEAFGDVLIRQADHTEAAADYMRYNGGTRIVYMRADNPSREVQLYDGKTNTLWSREIDYNMKTRVGRYRKRGYLQTDTTVLESNTGEYNMKTKDARFRGDVVVKDPEYRVYSSDLGYNTDTKVVRFFGPSLVTNDKSILQTSNGVYDTKNRIAHFISRASILNDAQYIEGDTLDYDRNTGFGLASGNVIAIDTAMKSTLFCGEARYNEKFKTLLAYDKPLMRRSDGKDSLFIRADTFFSAPDTMKPMPRNAQDSLQRTVDEIRSATGEAGIDSLALPEHGELADTLNAGSSGLIPVGDLDILTPDTSLVVHPPAEQPATLLTADTAGRQVSPQERLKHRMDAMVYREQRSEVRPATAGPADTAMLQEPLLQRRSLDSASAFYRNTPEESDTSGPRYFIGYHHVLIYSDSVQGKCDSIRYSQVDSLLRMYSKPLLWPRNSQLKGDMIYMLLDSNSLRRIVVPKNAIMVTRSGPEKAGMFDQVQGNVIRAYLTDNKIDSLIAEPNASSIYFIKDEDSAYVGSSEAKAERIEVLFDNEEIDRIYYRVDVEQTTTPMKDVRPASLRLSRFSWQENERPKTLEEFMQGTTLPHTPELLQISDGTNVETEDTEDDQSSEEASPDDMKLQQQGNRQ